MASVTSPGPRRIEGAYSVNVSKQTCPHPIGRHLWPIAEVSAHWGRVTARSWTTRGGKRELYQEGPLALMLHPDDLIQRTILFCGTIGAKGPLAHADLFEMELEDPVLGRRIRHHYKVEALPVLA